ncbi:hypothetical protein FBY35_4355 [Streptomyces sp. SLBN-118]|uniref:hypothetical protein n=1 Tax=Streptomyces sp. SLBN-118 TaxID=2768454 RepID=UPI00116A4B08|nr:hypothetical protein [Streptomyces sp. SLBN-118]TQK42910.1 hypothetical protein FBY35_4355 [Streptomyces sp. SLBN-118]
MTAAGGLALIALGALLRFFVPWQLSWVDVDLIGSVFMIAGAAALAFGTVCAFSTERRIARRVRSHVYERRWYDEPPQS